MPLALLTIGILAVIVAINGKQATLAQNLTQDFIGAGGFVYWIGAILVIGAIGKATGLDNAAKAFIGLIVVVYLVSQTGVWTQAQSALASLSAPATASSVVQAPDAQAGSIGSQVGSLAGSAIGGTVTNAATATAGQAIAAIGG